LVVLKPVYICQQGKTKKNNNISSIIQHVFYFYFKSDIDLVVFGEWATLPLNQLRDALIREGITDRDNIKVLDKASVSVKLDFFVLFSY
jgi:hypothetical protein